MHVLLSGGAGYIGSHTALALRQAGLTPVVLDDLSSGHDWAVKYGPLVRGDCGDAVAVRALCAEYKPIALIHFAALIDVAESVACPDRYRENNVEKAGRLFDTVLACGVRDIVFSSTAAVYGTPVNDDPITEDHPLQPINPYGETKRATEAYLQSTGAHSIILRYFNAAGAAPEAESIGEAHPVETHLIPKAILAGLGDGESLNIFGTDFPTPDGTAIRDYVHVSDIAAAHVAALRALQEGYASDIYNLGTGKGSSVKEVIGVVETALGHVIPVRQKPRRAGDPPRLVADASRARAGLGWTPRISLEKTVQSALVWHRSETYRRAMNPRNR